MGLGDNNCFLFIIDGTNTSNDSVSNDGTIDSVRPRLNKDVKMLFDKVVDGLACIEGTVCLQENFRFGENTTFL